jgi:hypothetical protein
MIIQEVLKGISGINEGDVRFIFDSGILCNWWRKVRLLPAAEVPLRLTDRNLHWHQNCYDSLDPLEGNEEFSGSPREFDRTRVLGCFLEDHKFGPGRCHALSLQ